MADREVTVKTNIVSGTDTISTVLQQQRQEIEALRRAQRELQRESANLPPVAQPLAALSAARVAAIQQARALEQAPAGLGRDDWRAVLERTRGQQVASQQRQQQQELAGLAQARLTGFIPSRDVAAVGDEEGGAAGGVRARTRRLRAAIDIAQGGPSAALGALVAVPGAIGLTAAGLLGLAGVAGRVASVFQQVRESVETVSAAYRQHAEDLQQARQTGTASPEALRKALTPAEQAEYARAEERGDEATQRRILQQARARAQQEATAAGPGGGALVAGLQSELELIEEEERSGMARFGQGLLSAVTLGMGPNVRENRRRAAFRRAGIPESQIPDTGGAPASPQQIQQWSQLAGGASVQAQANVATLTNALAPGGLPSLAPGGLSLRDLPNLFQSRQTDVLQVHEEVQREMVRDQREEQRFQQQYEIWVRILSRLEAGSVSMPAWATGAAFGAAS